MWEISEYRFASSPPEAVAMMRQGPGRGVYLAGGTDLLLFPPECDFVVDISRAGIAGVARTPAGDLFLGAAVTLQDLATNELVTPFAQGALSRVAAHCGNRPVRSTATLGGNLCNALPSCDMAPVLLVLDATCFITDENDQESLPLQDFFVGPRRTVLDDRLLVGVALPASAAGRRCATRKLTRSAEDIALVQVAAAVDVVDGTIESMRIALGAVAPVPLRATLAEEILAGFEIAAAEAAALEEKIADAAELAAGEADPIDDHRASAEYRRDMVRVLTKRVLSDILQENEQRDETPGGER